MTDALKYLTINNAEYYESETATASDTQGDPTCNPKTVIHTSNWRGEVMDTSNWNFEQKMLSNRTIPVFIPMMNPRIDPRIVPIVAVPQTLLMPKKKEFVADAACGNAWVNRNPRQVSRTGVDGSTPCDVLNDVSVEHSTYPFLIGIVATSPPCGLIGSLQVTKKRQSTSPGLGRNTQKLDAVVVGNFPNDLDYASIFSKVIGYKLYDISIRDL